MSTAAQATAETKSVAAERRTAIVRQLGDRWLRYPKDGLPPPPPESFLGAGYRTDFAGVHELRRLAAARSKAINIGE